MKRLSSLQWVIFLLIVVYIVGVVGLSAPSWQPLFLKLTPLNLILSSAVLIWANKNTHSRFVVWALFVAVVGYFIEVIGVKTEIIFGSYQYGDTLGLSLLDVPLAMALNWFILTVGIATLFQQYNWHPVYKSIGGALCMVGLDYLIEPVAIKLDFWFWKEGLIPAQNYVAWFIVAFILLLLYHIWIKQNQNRIAIILFSIQVVFFGLLNFML